MNNREIVGVHYDTESKSDIVNKPISIMKNARNFVKEKAKNNEEKSFEYEVMNSNISDTFKERQYRSLSIFTNLVQALRILVFIFYYFVKSVKKMKRDFHKSEQIPKRQSSADIGLKISDSQINRSEFDPG